MISLAGSYDSETFSTKREGGHMRTTQNLLSERGTAAAYENNEAQPVTIGYRLGFESVHKTQAIAQLTISMRFAQVYPDYRDALNDQARIAPASPARHAKRAPRPCD
ncbi:hypothetical protein [Senegalimassilia anaerobia]|uniref:hypothetical protein n=1 Tax=Senegalimassilia anaerobia TaxID=1473216 RepID=UPI003A92E8B6